VANNLQREMVQLN